MLNKSMVSSLLSVAGLVCAMLVSASVDAADGKYLIIYHQSLAGDALSDLVDLEDARGFDVVTRSIGDAVSLDSVRALVKNTYDQGGLAYVLLVGAARRDDDTTQSTDCYSNASLGNLIPTYFAQDGNGHLTAFDYWYAAVDTKSWSDPMKTSWPNLIIGRLPVLNATDLANYVAKLSAYVNDTQADAWEENALFISGDKDRGGVGSGVPTPQKINADIEQVDAQLSGEFTTRVLKYSDFASTAEREAAIVSRLDSGQALVCTMTTGANALNIAYMLLRGPDNFDAYTDLASNGRLAVWLSASCDLGQSDYEGGGGTRLWPENLLLAPNRGAIAYIGPTGFSIQDENLSFVEDFLQALLDYPNLSLGECFAYAQRYNTRVFRTNPATLRMYTFYGDPSLSLNTTATADEQQSAFDFEFGQPLPQENTTFVGCAQVTDSVCGVRTIAGTVGADRIYRLAAGDSYQASDSAYKSWLMYDDMSLQITQETRFFQYTINPMDHPEEVGRFALNGILSSGVYLSAGGTIADQYGTRLGAKYRTTPLGTSNWYVFDLQDLLGSTLDKLVLEYYANDPQSEGLLDVSLLNAAFTAEWGSAPTVGAISAPSSMLVSHTATVSVIATDNDANVGDTLVYAWSCTAGYFSGSGPSVTYHSPSTSQTVTITVNVTDLSEHVVMRQKAVQINTQSGGSCPFLYVLTGGEYKLENVVLTGSEEVDRASLVTTDYYALEYTPDIESGKVSVRIAEEEKEVSHIYGVSLLVYDLSELKEDDELAMASGGELLAISGPISPIYVETGEGFDVTDKLAARDEEMFLQYGPGLLHAVFDLQSVAQKMAGSAAATSGDVGVGTDPGTKEEGVYKVAGTTSPGNFITVCHSAGTGTKTVAGTILPRVKASLPSFVNMAPYVTPDNANWFSVEIAWRVQYRTDAVLMYQSRSLPVISELSLSDAADQDGRDIGASISGKLDVSYLLTPGNHAQLNFAMPEKLADAKQTKFVLKVTGYYETIDGQGQMDQPVMTGLSQNYPNPFNPKTTIHFSIGERSKVQLEIYNIVGQKVATLVDDFVSAGAHTVVWDATSFASGVYLSKLTIGGETFSRKMILLK